MSMPMPANGILRCSVYRSAFFGKDFDYNIEDEVEVRRSWVWEVSALEKRECGEAEEVTGEGGSSCFISHTALSRLWRTSDRRG